MSNQSILAFSTKGTGTNEEYRMRTLLAQLGCEVFPFDVSRKFHCCRALLRRIRKLRPGLVAMEGTGLAGGLACILGRLVFRIPYLVSSGDAVGPFIGSRFLLLRPVAAIYERVLCGLASGFVGWTPYLAGRALTFGTPRVMTAPGWADFTVAFEIQQRERNEVRAKWGIPRDAIVFGIIGSLVWNRKYRYSYGSELVRAINRTQRTDVYALIVGSGNGLAEMQRLVAPHCQDRVVFAGPVPGEQIRAHLAAMDVGSLPQSVDGVGSFRYTTKISEYVAARLPIVTGQIPLAYDLDSGWAWRLAGPTPWSHQYVSELAELMQTISPDQISRRREAVVSLSSVFDRPAQIERMTAFIGDILADAERK